MHKAWSQITGLITVHHITKQYNDIWKGLITQLYITIQYNDN